MQTNNHVVKSFLMYLSIVPYRVKETNLSNVLVKLFLSTHFVSLEMFY